MEAGLTSDEPAPKRRFPRFVLWIIGLGLIVAVVAIVAVIVSRNTDVAPPARLADPVNVPRHESTIAVPLDVDTALLLRELERAIPRTLWSINRHVDKCVPAQRVRLFKRNLKVTPSLGCDVIGTVTRGAIRLRGQGEDIIADVPIRAQVAARDVGGFLKGKTATGSAMVHARIRLSLSKDWAPGATVRLSYGWTNPPGIDFLGQRITFTDKVDEKLAPIVRELERTLPREIAKLNIRAKVADAWRQSFTSLELNAENPPVWMRITPQRLSYGGYSLSGGKLRLRLGLTALTETFVGPKPADPVATPLPQLVREAPGSRLRLFIPVIADYAQLEPVVLRALTKRSQRPFELPGIGPVTARFDNVVVYGTEGGRIALGLTLAARRNAGGGETHGMVWVTAKPVNAPGSLTVAFQDVQVRGNTDGLGGDLLVQLVSNPQVANEIAASLTQNFARDFRKLMGKVQRAIVEKRAGAFVIRAEIGQVRTGSLYPAGQGLYLPVWTEGSARVEYRPR
ncbi:DUF4403 family protein [Sphingomonas sp. AOB5]|uniref:DUF4403 family protein n=1 Tax=Sphingomonas sp. AOB5 TaxID=3034017 RepID=UPI0023F7F41E|nr:DUF4403 family protein [Sphingomonas sp. AOB5]MDF7777022.1 DUF4403 family protein [Sphingomonas sp. AOB5]